MSDEYQKEWEDLSERELLQGIFIELTQIRALLSDADNAGVIDRDQAEDVYVCQRCPGGTEVREGERERHATGEHNAPPGEWRGMFTEIEQ